MQLHKSRDTRDVHINKRFPLPLPLHFLLSTPIATLFSAHPAVPSRTPQYQ